jgi:hypothetical protein
VREDRTPLAAFAAALTLLMAASIGLQVARDRLPVERRATERYLLVPSDTLLARLTVAFQTLAADVYWLRTIQHYGGDRLAKGGGGKYELLYPLLEITTTLDPRFTIAYRFGAIFLAEPFPAARDVRTFRSRC